MHPDSGFPRHKPPSQLAAVPDLRDAVIAADLENTTKPSAIANPTTTPRYSAIRATIFTLTHALKLCAHTSPIHTVYQARDRPNSESEYTPSGPPDPIFDPTYTNPTVGATS